MNQGQSYHALLSLFALLLLSCNSQAQKSPYDAVYQYEVPVGTRTAYLWIPPECRYVRGIIFAAENALERNWMESPIVRRAAVKDNLAMVWLADGEKSVITYEMNEEAAALMDTMFGNLAIVSGYSEIENAPLIVTGHSWNGRMAWNYPAQRPGRVIAAVPIRTYPMPDTLRFKGIPLLYIVGQTSELPEYNNGRPGDRDFFWPVVRKTAAALRNKNEDNLIGAAFNHGGCHMDWTDEQSQFLSLFIHKACKYRLINDKPTNGKVILKSIRPEDGWLTDTGGLAPDHFKPAPYFQYKGNPDHAYWFFDGEMAKAAIAFNGYRHPKEKQMLTFIQHGDSLPVERDGYVHLQWSSERDGVTFHVSGGFLKQVPGGLIDSGKVLYHANGKIKLYQVMGPAVQLNDTTFKIQFDRQQPRNVMIMADEPGNDTFRRAVQPAILAVQYPLTQAGAQHIDFPVIKDQPLDIKQIPLHATASSGLPVQYYIRSGPAIIDGNRITLTKIPIRSKYPVKITVVACQLGSTIEPLFQSAQPVIRNFYIKK
jgi:hypothetical protein